MNFIKTLIEKYNAVFLITGMIFIMGLLFMFTIPVAYYPDFSVPAIFVTTAYPGADPESVEQDVTRPIEESIASISGIEEINSTSQESFSLIRVSFVFGADIKEKTRNVQEKLDQIKSSLPRNSEIPNIVTINDFVAAPVELSISSSKRSLSELKLLVENTLAPQISRLNGVANVKVSGGIETVVDVEIDPVRLMETGLSFSQLAGLISSGNTDFPLGDIQADRNAFTLRMQGRYQSKEDLGNVFITLAQNKTVRLKDIARITIIEKDQTRFSRLNLKDSIGLIIRKPSGGNSIQISDEVKRWLKNSRKNIPSDVRIEFIKDESITIRSAISNVFVSLLLGSILASIVIFLIMGNFRNTIIIVLSIPITIISSFVLIKLFNLSINTVSLGGLGLAVGMIVDSSIVVMENAFRYLESNPGGNRNQLIAQATKEVALPISASVMTTVVVFLPMAFTSGLAKVLLGELALVIVFALTLSILVSVLLVPVLSSFLIRTDFKMNPVSGRFIGLLDRLKNLILLLLQKALVHRKTALAIFTGIAVIGFAAGSLIQTGLLPNSDQGEFQITLTFPKGTPSSFTNQKSIEIEKWLSQQKWIRLVNSLVGEDLFFSTITSNSGVITVFTNRSVPTNEAIRQTREFLKNIPDLKSSIRIIDATAGFQRSDIDVNIIGNDLTVLRNEGQKFADLLSNEKGMVNISSNLTRGVPSFIFRPDREITAASGVNLFDLAQLIRNSKSGLTVTKYKLDNYDVDIELTIKNSDTLRLEEIKNLPVYTPRGGLVPLKALGRFEEGESPAEIRRTAQKRVVNISGDFEAGANKNQLKKRLNNLIGSTKLKEGYIIEQQGSSRAIAESFSTLGIALLIGILLIYIVMGVQFNSLKLPFVIALSIPFSLPGALIALLITGSALNLPSFLGIIVLAGIVVNNGIILLDFVIEFRKQYSTLNEAILNAASIRFRPIMMTSLTTIVGMIFLALNIGGGGEALAPLAIAIIGGLTYSIFVSMILIPVIYTYFEGKKIKEN